MSEGHRVEYQHGESGERGPSRAVSCLHLAGSVQEETVEGLQLLEEGGGWAAVSNCRGLVSRGFYFCSAITHYNWLWAGKVCQTENYCGVYDAVL